MKERHFFQIRTPWKHREQPFVSFATGVASCVVPAGAFKRTEDREEDNDEADEDEAEQVVDDDQETKAEDGASAYTVPSENYSEEPTLVRWLSTPIQPSVEREYSRHTSIIRRGALWVDFFSALLSFLFLWRSFIPPTSSIHPIDSKFLIALTVLQILTLLATAIATMALRRRHSGTRIQMFMLDVVSNCAVAASLFPMLYAFAYPQIVTVSDPVFALLPLGTVKVLPVFIRLDVSYFASTRRAMSVFYRCFSLFFTVSWLLAAYSFVLAHGDPDTRRDECAPGTIWMHTILMMVGPGLSNDLDMCTLSSASRPEAIAVTAIVLSVVYIVFLSIIVMTPFHRRSFFASRILYNENGAEKVCNFATCVDLSWLKRRRLTVHICDSQHLHPHKTRALLHELLDAESTQYPGTSVSFLLPPLPDRITTDKSVEIISGLIAVRQEWAERVAVVRASDGASPDNCASRSALTKAGVPFAKKILLPAAGTVASEQADDRSLLWCSVVRSLAEDDAEIFAEVYFPSSKMPLLEAGANHVVCLLELQLQLLGRSVGCPGISDLVMALCERRSEMALDVRDRNHSFPPGGAFPGTVPLDAKLDEEEEDEGVSRILPLKVPIRYNDLPFCEAAYHLYNEFGLCVVAANASCDVDIRDESGTTGGDVGNSHGEVVLLNPAFRLKAGQRCVHAIAASARSAFEAHTSREDEEEEEEKGGQEGRGGEASEEKKQKERQKEKKKMLLARRRPTSRDATELLLPANLLRPSEIPHLVPRPVRRGAPWKTPQRDSDFRRKSKHTMTGLALLMRSDPARAWMIADDTFDAGRPLWSTVRKNRIGGRDSNGIVNDSSGRSEWTELDSATEAGIKGHVVVVIPSVGIMLNQVHRVIAAIRAEERQTWVPIVILSKNPPPDNVCHGNDVGVEPREASALPHIYWVKGDPCTRESLIRAGVQVAQHVCVCPSLVMNGIQGTHSDDHDAKLISIRRNRGLSEQVRTVHLVRILSAAKSRQSGLQAVISSCLDDPHSVLPDDSGAAAAVSACGESQETYVPLRRLRGLLPQLVANPFLGDVIAGLASGGHTGPPEDIGPTGIDEEEVSGSAVPFMNCSVLCRTRKYLFQRSRIRSSFVRTRMVPKYLAGQPFIKLWEFAVYNDHGSIPIALLRVCGINEEIEAAEQERDQKRRGPKPRGSGSVAAQMSASRGGVGGKQSKIKMGAYVRRRILLNPSRDFIIRESDCFLSIVPSQYDHLMRHAHRVKAEARDETDMHFARQLCDRTSQLISKQLDAIVEVQTRCRQMHDARSDQQLRKELRRKASQSTNSDIIAQARGHAPPVPVVQDMAMRQKAGGCDPLDEEDQDIASQVLSLLRSSTSLLSILQWRSKRLIALRGDVTANGSEALVKAQKLFQDTCMSESLIELMQDRDARIRAQRQEFKDRVARDSHQNIASISADVTGGRNAEGPPSSEGDENPKGSSSDRHEH